MSKATSTKEEFEEQIRQEQIVKDCAGDEDSIGKARTRVDEDGTVFEWDMDKKAWFPKIDADFIAQYQMNYGTGTETTTADASNTSTAPPSTTSASFPSPSDPNYSEWYNYYYGNSADGQSIDTTTKEYKEWYDYYYSNQDKEKGEKKEEEKKEEQRADVEEEEEEEEEEEAHEEGSSGQSKELQEEYWKQYYEYYQSQGLEAPEPKDLTGNSKSAVSKETKAQDKSEDKEKGKKGEKRKAADPPSWFNVEEDKNTNVYVHGLPPDTTEDEYKELMNKCGLVMYDPRTRNLKLKLYRKANGELKGDGLCCYIKPESVELALQILDGSEIRGYKLHVERAKFEMKGSFDPTKRKKKLSNREKKKFQEKQSKLFDWRPDKVNVGRGRHERIVIIKNVFDPKDFDKDPGQINEIRADLRQECAKYGEVKKVQVYDHNAEGVVSVTFTEPEEADVCLEAITGRWFAQRQLVAETWDGNTKYDVVETEKEKEKRLKQWEEYLEGKTDEDKTKENSENEKTDSEEKGKAPLSKEGEKNVSDSDSKAKPSQDQMDIETDDEEEEEEEEEEADMKEDGSAHKESSTDKKENEQSESDSAQGDAKDS